MGRALPPPEAALLGGPRALRGRPGIYAAGERRKPGWGGAERLGKRPPASESAPMKANPRGAEAGPSLLLGAGEQLHPPEPQAERKPRHLVVEVVCVRGWRAETGAHLGGRTGNFCLEGVRLVPCHHNFLSPFSLSLIPIFRLQALALAAFL